MQRNGRKRYTLNLTPVVQTPEAAAGKACLKVLESFIHASPSHWYQWKKFGQLLDLKTEVQHDHQEVDIWHLNCRFRYPFKHKLATHTGL